MRQKILYFIALIGLAALLFSTQRLAGQGAAVQANPVPAPIAQEPTPPPDSAELTLLAAQQNALPVFRYPVVPGAVISGYFDHQTAGGIVHHYDGRQNAPGAGYSFQCPSVYMNDWVGCQDMIAGEPACSNSREIWYDGHKGIDYEFASNWHTGAFCDPGKFSGITMPIYAPAAGRIWFAGTDPNRWANGWHIRMQHDVNKNGNYDDDMFRSVYLHFSAYGLAVSAGQIINEGAYLGRGGSTGYSSSPHLHFEVQRSADYFQNTYWSVDPYGWQGTGADPWRYTNQLLFRLPPPVEYSDFVYIPQVGRAEHPCPSCGEQLRNNGFESGRSDWNEAGSQVITSTSYSNLPISPNNGSWLAWFGGYNGADDAITQAFTVPQGGKNAVLRYYLYVTTEETFGTADVFTTRLRDSGGSTVRSFDQINNTFGDPGRWVLREFSFTLDGRQGQTIFLEIRGTTDGAYRTSFYVDDVSLVVTE